MSSSIPTSLSINILFQIFYNTLTLLTYSHPSHYNRQLSIIHYPYIHITIYDTHVHIRYAKSFIYVYFLHLQIFQSPASEFIYYCYKLLTLQFLAIKITHFCEYITAFLELYVHYRYFLTAFNIE